MKSFDLLVKDLEKMIGLQLESVKPGSELTILEIDISNNRIILESVTGKVKSRPLNELSFLWSAICKKPAIHVDSELGGSGSSRNQPETILANLPFIGFFKHHRKKHLSLINKNYSAFGELKEIDSIYREEIIENLTKYNSGLLETTQIIIVSDDLTAHANLLNHASKTKGVFEQEGIYRYENDIESFLLVSSNSVSNKIPVGTYPVVKGPPAPNQEGKAADILGEKYIWHNSMGLNLIYKL